MPTIQDARSILSDAEKGLRELMQRDIREQRYTELAEVARMADGVARLARGELFSSRVEPASASVGNGRATVARTSRARAAAASSGSYPRFARQGDKLVKTGWSKRAREEYEHRAPRSAVLAFTEHLGKLVTAGRAFTADEITPVHDAAGQELPSYQVYLGIAWLRAMGVLKKKGRDGYVLTAEELDGSLFDQLWINTTER